MDHVYQKISKKLNDSRDQKLEIDRTELQKWAATLIDIEKGQVDAIVMGSSEGNICKCGKPFHERDLEHGMCHQCFREVPEKY